MKFRLRRIGVLRAAVVGGMGYAIMGLVFAPFFLLLSLFAPSTGAPGEWMMGPVFALMLPVFYGVVGFIGCAIAAFAYNLIAMMVGGLDIELEPVDGAATVAPATLTQPSPPPPPPSPGPQTFTGY